MHSQCCPRSKILTQYMCIKRTLIMGISKESSKYSITNKNSVVTLSCEQDSHLEIQVQHVTDEEWGHRLSRLREIFQSNFALGEADGRNKDSAIRSEPRPGGPPAKKAHQLTGKTTHTICTFSVQLYYRHAWMNRGVDRTGGVIRPASTPQSKRLVGILLLPTY